MLNIFLKTIILYVFLLIVMRLMGKRQLGELQAFEFAITLVAAELVCLPMSDPSMPIVYGIIPVFTLFILHLIITLISFKNLKFRKLVNGKPLILISEGSVDTTLMKKCSMNVNDLMEALRNAGYFNIGEVQYAILETNGQLSVMPKFANKPATTADLGLIEGGQELPYMIISEGKFMTENLDKLGVADKDQIMSAARLYNLKQQDIFLLTLTQSKNLFIQPYGGSAINALLEE